MRGTGGECGRDQEYNTKCCQRFIRDTRTDFTPPTVAVSALYNVPRFPALCLNCLCPSRQYGARRRTLNALTCKVRYLRRQLGSGRGTRRRSGTECTQYEREGLLTRSQRGKSAPATRRTFKAFPIHQEWNSLFTRNGRTQNTEARDLERFPQAGMLSKSPVEIGIRNTFTHPRSRTHPVASRERVS